MGGFLYIHAIFLYPKAILSPTLADFLQIETHEPIEALPSPPPRIQLLRARPQISRHPLFLIASSAKPSIGKETVPKVCFTSNLRRHVDCPEQNVPGATVAEALEAVFAGRPALRGYILDEQGCLHRHMALLVNGQAVRDRKQFAQPVGEDDEIFVMQALSGG